MAERTNPYNMAYELNVERMVVIATLRKKDPETEKQEVLDSVEYSFNDVDEKLHPVTSLYGLSKLLQDRCSEVPAGPEKIPAMREVHDQFKRGEYEKARVVGPSIVSVEVEALAELKGVSIPDAQAALKKYSKEQREAILGNPQIVARAEEIAKRRATTEGNVASLDDLIG